MESGLEVKVVREGINGKVRTRLSFKESLGMKWKE